MKRPGRRERENLGAGICACGCGARHADIKAHELNLSMKRLADDAMADRKPSRLVMPPEEIRLTSSTGGQKGTKLARYDLIPAEALRIVAETYGRGATKYDDHNWRKGYNWSLSYAALQRHAWKFWGGEDLDPETGTPHMACVAFHALSLITFMVEQPEFDDRQTAKQEDR